MKRAGWVGIVAIGVGILMVWAGFQGVSLLDTLKSVLTGSPMPTNKPSTTPGNAGASGFAPSTGDPGDPNNPQATDDPGAGTGVSATGGGGW